jgi:hypothetical protein
VFAHARALTINSRKLSKWLRKKYHSFVSILPYRFAGQAVFAVPLIDIASETTQSVIRHMVNLHGDPTINEIDVDGVGVDSAAKVPAIAHAHTERDTDLATRILARWIRSTVKGSVRTNLLERR